MTIIHRQGKDHGNADALSRLQGEEGCSQYRSGSDLTELPCHGCKYCVRAHETWNSFEKEVDDVVPLSQVKRNTGCADQQSPKINVVQLSTAWDLKCEVVKQEQAKEKDFLPLIEWLVKQSKP